MKNEQRLVWLTADVMKKLETARRTSGKPISRIVDELFADVVTQEKN